MTGKSDAPGKSVDSRFRHLSADVREERLVRYVLAQVEDGRHVTDVLNDPYVVEHFGEVARSRILEHPEVIKGIEESMRREFAGYGDSVAGSPTTDTTEDSARRTNDADLSDL